MKDDGKSTDEIMLTLNISKGHIEKWYSPKVRERERERGRVNWEICRDEKERLKGWRQ